MSDEIIPDHVPGRKGVVFSIGWTIVATVFVAAFTQTEDWAAQGPLFHAGILAMPLVGVFFIWWTRRKYRRNKSLRIVTKNGVTEYIWTLPNGKERRSAEDPRPRWEFEDRLSD